MRGRRRSSPSSNISTKSGKALQFNMYFTEVPMSSARPRLPGPIQALFFRLGACLLGPLARVNAFDPLARGLARAFARVTLWVNRARPSSSLTEVATEWDRMFRHAFPASHLTLLEEDCAQGEITAPCPLGLAGTGDLPACDRAMEYDREMVRRLGGELTVIESQARAGVHRCRIAIRARRP